MNLFQLSWAYLRQRPLNTLLNLLLIGLGTGTIILLLLLSTQLADKLHRDAKGFDVVIGAKGSPLQLILSSIYHADLPTGNIALSAATPWMQHLWVKTAIPLALGDSYQSLRIVGTTPDYLQHYHAQFAAGKVWEKPLEVVLGAQAARTTQLQLGQAFSGSHGLSAGGETHVQAHYQVVGILQPTGTILDQLILTSMESVWAVHEHHEHSTQPANASEHELTAVLITYKTPLAAISFPRLVNAQSALQAAAPPLEIARLLKLIGVGAETLQVFGAIFSLIAFCSIGIALLNALQERRYDLAIMRTLGASRAYIFWQLLCEGLLLAASGVIVGLLFGHFGASFLGWWMNDLHALHFTGALWLPQESWVILASLGLGIVAALIPAIQAYRTDLARILANS